MGGMCDFVCRCADYSRDHSFIFLTRCRFPIGPFLPFLPLLRLRDSYLTSTHSSSQYPSTHFRGARARYKRLTFFDDSLVPDSLYDDVTHLHGIFRFLSLISSICYLSAFCQWENVIIFVHALFLFVF